MTIPEDRCADVGIEVDSAEVTEGEVDTTAMDIEEALEELLPGVEGEEKEKEEEGTTRRGTRMTRRRRRRSKTRQIQSTQKTGNQTPVKTPRTWERIRV